ncbi:hypothetical protein HY969_03325 [Candidatus Kaiserbacteria bacterium]|nr:hypothetical protein [Candidatus Kaiserbacteria bacterium]
MSAKLRINIAAGVVTLLACSQLFGYAIGSDHIKFFAKSLMFAPFPFPFSGIRGYDSILAYRTYTLHFRNGESQDVELDTFLMETLTGPHRRKIPYLQILRFAPRFPRPMVLATLSYMFCKGDVHDTYVAKLQDLDSISVSIRYLPEFMDARVWQYEIACAS